MVILSFAGCMSAREGSWKELNSKGMILYQRGEYSEATKVAEESLRVAERTYGPDHPNVATSLNNLAEIYRFQGKYAEAEPLWRRSLTILEKALGPEHPDVATVCENMAKCYRGLGKKDEAEILEGRARKIRSGR
jgi:tetratricopeptide (TPR) repeat protein